MKIIAVDPGGSTGIARGIKEDVGWSIDMVTLTQEDHHLALWHAISSFQPDIVVCESFQQRGEHLAAQDFMSLQYIGVCKLYCQDIDVKYTQQSSATGKAFWTNDKIRHLLLWNKEQVPHGIDALRHLLYYITFGLKDLSFAEQLKGL